MSPDFGSLSNLDKCSISLSCMKTHSLSLVPTLGGVLKKCLKRMLPPYVMQENHALYRPLARHPLAVLRRHTFRSSDTTRVSPWLCCRKDLVHLSSLHCLPPRVMPLGARCEPTALCCCVLRWLLSNVPQPPSLSFSLPSQLCSISPP